MKILFFIAFLLIQPQLFAQNAPILSLKNDFESMTLEGFVMQFDSEKLDSAEQILKEKGFQISRDVPTFGADNNYHWLKFELKSTTQKQLILEYQQIFIDEISFYLFENDSLINQKTSSWENKYSEKSFPSRYHAFSFFTKKNTSYTILLKCHNSRIKYSNRGFIRMFDKNIFQQEADFYFFQISLSVGCLIFVAILAIVFFSYSKKRIYLFYTFYISSMAFYILVVNGIFNQFFDPRASFLAQPEFGSVLVVFILAFHSLYVLEFFKISKKILLIAFKVFILISLFQLILLISESHFYIPFGVMYISFSILIIWSLAINLRINRKAVYLYLAASGPLFLTFLLVILGAIGLTKINSFFYYYAHIPLALEGIGLGLALLYIFNDERKKIEKELEKNRDETTQRILFAQEQERQRLARDLHDDLGGSLSVLNRELDEFNEKNANVLDFSVNLTKKIVHDLRTISHHLMPSSFQEKGLVNVVKETVEMANRQTEVRFLFVTKGKELRLNLDTEINIYRIIKELISNVLKHSEAKQSIIQLIYFEEFLYVSIEDDGKGFDFSNNDHWGIGLNNINLRVKYLKAKIVRESSSSGTLVNIEIPYNAPES